MITSPSTKNLVDRAWLDVVAWLPKDTDALAFETGALIKRREIRGGVQLLRVAFAYAVLDLSLTFRPSPRRHTMISVVG